ncbi:MAG: hypothetical protein CFE24_15475 [Flavobacterium sp. BFFFF2]|nr:MAG: hypothetical protein CFE24_15475 [Flavobacterium sp. BFFFF2]
MPTNYLKKYNQLLELLYSNPFDNVKSIKAVFDRDFNGNYTIKFYSKNIEPTPSDSEDKIERLFNHLTRVVTDEKTKKREFESERAIRIHWIKHHLEKHLSLPNVLTFKVEDENRVYLLDKSERYIIVLEPLRNGDAFYLLSAYKLLPSNYKKIMRKYEKRSQPI